MADEDLDLDVDGEEAPKSKKKLFIIIGAVVLVIILAVGGMFAMGVFSGDEPVAEEGVDDDEADAEEDEEGDGKKKKKKKGGDEEEDGEVLSDDALYWPMEPPFVMNFEGRSKAKYMQIKLVAMSRSQKSMDAFKKHMPAVRNELTFLLGGQKYTELSSAEGKEQLREEILETVNKIVKGEGGGRGLEKIYFTSFVMQ